MENHPEGPDSRISQTDGLKYWESIPATASGMLGGYPQISRIDLRGSLNFLAKLRRGTPSPKERLTRGVDCGAGIGRVTAGCLSKICKAVDLVEPVESFAVVAKALELSDCEMGDVYMTGLEDWVPAKEYDVIWAQWVVGHLTDAQLVKFLIRCKAAVGEHGWIVLKENLSTDREGKDSFDDIDSSVTRSDGSFRRLFEESGLSILRTELQSGFPKSLYPVRLYALRASNYVGSREVSARDNDP